MKMIDVGGKAPTRRVAVASGAVRMSPGTASLVAAGRIEKGDVLATARLAAIMGAKRTPDLVPLCHPIALTKVEPEVWVEPEEGVVRVRVRAETVDRTGVEMEALTGASAACLTVYDMCKSIEPAMEITTVRLEEKSGGKSGDWRR